MKIDICSPAVEKQESNLIELCSKVGAKSETEQLEARENNKQSYGNQRGSESCKKKRKSSSSPKTSVTDYCSSSKLESYAQLDSPYQVSQRRYLTAHEDLERTPESSANKQQQQHQRLIYSDQYRWNSEEHEQVAGIDQSSAGGGVSSAALDALAGAASCVSTPDLSGNFNSQLNNHNNNRQTYHLATTEQHSSSVASSLAHYQNYPAVDSPEHKLADDDVKLSPNKQGNTEYNQLR